MRVFAAQKGIERGLCAIERDRRSGAGELARRALQLLGSAKPAAGTTVTRYRRGVVELARELAGARPAMIVVAGVVRRVAGGFERRSRDATTTADVHAILQRECDDVMALLDGARGRVAAHFASRFAVLRRPMVISYSSQVLEALRALPAGRVALTVCESRPGLEGRRTARVAGAWAKTVRLICEAAMALAMEQCDSVVIGCDSIGPDGSITNKTGSAALARVATTAKVPVIVLGNTFKFTHTRRRHTEVHPPSEIWPRAPRGIRIDNVWFERVDARYIGHIVLENGVFAPRRIAAMQRSSPRR